MDVDFWSELAKLKLDNLKLSEDPVPLRGKSGKARTVSTRNARLCCDISVDSAGFLKPATNADQAAPLQLERLSFEEGSPQPPVRPLPRRNPKTARHVQRGM